MERHNLYTRLTLSWKNKATKYKQHLLAILSAFTKECTIFFAKVISCEKLEHRIRTAVLLLHYKIEGIPLLSIICSYFGGFLIREGRAI